MEPIATICRFGRKFRGVVEMVPQLHFKSRRTASIPSCRAGDICMGEVRQNVAVRLPGEKSPISSPNRSSTSHLGAKARAINILIETAKLFSVSRNRFSPIMTNFLMMLREKWNPHIRVLAPKRIHRLDLGVQKHPGRLDVGGNLG